MASNTDAALGWVYDTNARTFTFTRTLTYEEFSEFVKTVGAALADVMAADPEYRRIMFGPYIAGRLDDRW